eukprot:gene3004-1986_t
MFFVVYTVVLRSIYVLGMGLLVVVLTLECLLFCRGGVRDLAGKVLGWVLMFGDAMHTQFILQCFLDAVCVGLCSVASLEFWILYLMWGAPILILVCCINIGVRCTKICFGCRVVYDLFDIMCIQLGADLGVIRKVQVVFRLVMCDDLFCVLY